MGEAIGIANDSSEPRGGALKKLTGKAIFGWLNDIFAGSICGMLSVLFGISYAALIFAGPLTPGLSSGLAATFLTTAVAALVVAFRSSIPFMIAGPDSSTSAVTAALSAALAHKMMMDGGGAPPSFSGVLSSG